MKKLEMAKQLVRAEQLLARIQRNETATDDAFLTPIAVAREIRDYFSSHQRYGWELYRNTKLES